MDARRLTDGMLVSIKKVRTDSRELQIATFLSSATLRRDPRESESLRSRPGSPEGSQDPAIFLMVMPFLRYVDDPAFDCVGSILDCVEQLLEVGSSMHRSGRLALTCQFLQGLVFLHEHNLAHR